MKLIARSIIALWFLSALLSGAIAQSLPSKWLSAASLNPTLVNAGTTYLTAILPINTTTTLYYLKLYDKATAPSCGTDTPKWTIPIPYGASNSGGGVSLPLPPGGLHFFLGLGWCLTGALADNDTTNAATGVAINMSWTTGQ
jgi:hypothetical protein